MTRAASALVSREAARAALFGASSIFREDATALAVSSSQELKEKLANQLFYDTAAQSGKFFGYEAMGSSGFKEGFANAIAFKESSTPVYIVPPNTPRVKLWFVEDAPGSETLRGAGYSSNLQSFFEAVPMPSELQIPLRSIAAAGSDKQAVIWCPATGEMWEMHRLERFATGAHMGEWKFGFGAYYPSVAASNGVPEHGWGVSGSGVSIIAGNISCRDLVNVLRGKPIGHALGVSVIASTSEHLEPATRNNPRSNTAEKVTGTATANPAFGLVDAVPMGLWCRFPPTSRASEHGMSAPLEAAIYEAVREHALFVRDSSGICNFYLDDPRPLGSPYADENVNGFAGAVSLGGGNTAEQIAAYVNANVPTGWTDPTLSNLEEEFHGIHSALAKMPWRDLEQLEPRPS